MSAAAFEQVSDISIELTERQVSSKSAENSSRSAEAPALHELATQRRAASTSILEQVGTHIITSQRTSEQKGLQETLLPREVPSGPVWHAYCFLHVYLCVQKTSLMWECSWKQACFERQGGWLERCA